MGRCNQSSEKAYKTVTKVQVLTPVEIDQLVEAQRVRDVETATTLNVIYEVEQNGAESSSPSEESSILEEDSLAM